MDLSFSEQQNALRKTVRDFVEREMPREWVRAFDRRDEFPHDLVRKFCALDLARINIPKEYGGKGGDVLDLMILFEEISKRLAVLSWSLGNILLYGNEIITVNGSDEQRAKYLPRLAKGEIMFSFGLTEPNAGSDAASIRTKAVLEGGEWVINGNKMFITGAGVTDYTVTFTRTSDPKYNGITAFIVDTKLPGYSTRPVEKLGYHGSNTCEVNYDNVRVRPEDILGGEKGLNNGWKQEMKLLNQERLVLSSCCIGIAEAAVTDALTFAAAEIKKSPGTDTQSLQHTLAEMATDLEAMRQLAYSAAWKEVQRMQPVLETSMSKYFCAETAKKICLRGINVMGETGSLMAHDMQRYFRDILILAIGGGTSQIQKNILSKVLGM